MGGTNDLQDSDVSKVVKLDPRRAATEVAVADIRNQYRGKAVISLGRDMALDIPRVTTGSFGLDWAIGGGYPRERLTEMVGPESSGKTTLALIAAARAIEAGLHVLWATAEEFAWAYAVRIGIPQDCRTFGMLRSEEGNTLLDAVIDAVRSCVWDLIVIDSVAALENWEYLAEGKDGSIERGVGERSRGGEAAMLGEFMRRLYASFARSARLAHERSLVEQEIRDLRGQKTTPARVKRISELQDALPPEVRAPAILAINQLRDRGFSGQQQAPQPPGGRGLRHGKSIQISLYPSEMIWEAAKKGEDAKNLLLLARRTIFQIDKNKVGPPKRRSAIVLGQADKDPYRVGHIDRADEVVSLAKRFNVVQQSGSWYSIQDVKFQGDAALLDAVRSDEGLRLALEAEVMKVAG